VLTAAVSTARMYLVQQQSAELRGAVRTWISVAYARGDDRVIKIFKAMLFALGVLTDVHEDVPQVDPLRGAPAAMVAHLASRLQTRVGVKVVGVLRSLQRARYMRLNVTRMCACCEMQAGADAAAVNQALAILVEEYCQLLSDGHPGGPLEELAVASLIRVRAPLTVTFTPHSPHSSANACLSEPNRCPCVSSAHPIAAPLQWMTCPCLTISSPLTRGL